MRARGKRAAKAPARVSRKMVISGLHHQIEIAHNNIRDLEATLILSLTARAHDDLTRKVENERARLLHLALSLGAELSAATVARELRAHGRDRRLSLDVERGK